MATVLLKSLATCHDIFTLTQYYERIKGVQKIKVPTYLKLNSVSTIKRNPFTRRFGNWNTYSLSQSILRHCFLLSFTHLHVEGLWKKGRKNYGLLYIRIMKWYH